MPKGGGNRQLGREGRSEGARGQAVPRGGSAGRDSREPHPLPPRRATRPAAAAAPCPPRSHCPRPRCRGRKSAAQSVPPGRRRGSAAPRKAPDRSGPGRRALGPAATAAAHRPGSWRRAPGPARRLPVVTATDRGGATAAARPTPASGGRRPPNARLPAAPHGRSFTSAPAAPRAPSPLRRETSGAP